MRAAPYSLGKHLSHWRPEESEKMTHPRRRQRLWLLAATIGWSAIACAGKSTSTQTSLPNVDSGTGTRDSGASPPADASGDAEIDSSPSPPAIDAEPDASPPLDDAGSADSTIADAAEASSPIPCDETSSCASEIQLPTLTVGPAQTAVHTSGETSNWYVVEVTPAAVSGTTIGMYLYVNAPPGMEFDLEAYVFTSSPTPSQVCPQPAGTADGGIIYLSWPNTFPYAHRWLTVHVVAKNGMTCATGESWNLNIYASAP